MKHPRHIFAAAKKDTTLELLVYDEIGDGWFGGVTAKEVSAQLKAAGAFDRILMRINSPGGAAFEGVAIYNLLRSQGKPIEVYVDGIAASAASLVAMAGDTIHMGEGSMMMIHNAMGIEAGDANAMRAFAAVLDKVSASMADIYVARTELPKEELQAIMSAETWLNAQEAVDKGFADDSVAVEQPEEATALAASFDLSRFNRVPEGLRMAHARFAAQAKTKRVDGEDLTKDCFAYRPSDNLEDWKLPIKFSTEEKTKSHIRNAIARYDQTDMPDAAEKAKAWDRIVAAAKEHGIEIQKNASSALVTELEARNADLTQHIEAQKRAAEQLSARAADLESALSALRAQQRSEDERAQAVEQRTDKALAEALRQIEAVRGDVHRRLRLRALS